ncbi:MAG: hypothetical protein HY460_02160, partial [Parcubacteria group bacterium]|nr:hypothetical protein [Parcubacteria group bacterium]
MNIVIPLAGKDTRFGTLPKPLIKLGGKLLIERILESHRITPDDQLIFIVLEEYNEKFGMSDKLRVAFGEKIVIRTVDHLSPGSPWSIFDGARDLIDNDTNILIELGDVLRTLNNLYTDIERLKDQVAGVIPVERRIVADHLWGYVLADQEGSVKELREKEEVPSSNLATMGLYYFSHGKDFVWAAEEMMRRKSFLYKEMFFVGPTYNEMIRAGMRVAISENRIEAVLGSQE